MSVGIYDQDSIIYTHAPLNLEVMKISAYWKSQKQVVKLATDFCPQKYGSFYYVKDYQDNYYYPNLHKYPNLTYSGMAFSNNVYKPLPIEWEMQQPDNYVYTTMRDKFSTTQEATRYFNYMLNAQHMRLSLDGATPWNKFESQIRFGRKFHVLYLHDYDLANIEGARPLIEDLAATLKFEKRPISIGTKFPLRFEDEEKMLQWSGAMYENPYMKYQFNGYLSDAALAQFIQTREKISYDRQFEYVITYSATDEDDFFLRVLPEIYKQVIFLRMNKKKISLKYESNFFSCELAERTVGLLECYCNSNFYYENALPFDSFYSFCSRLREEHIYRYIRYTIQEAREVFQFVREKNYELFKLFYELHSVELRGGKLYESN